MGTQTPAHANQGFELLQGASVFMGKILGGCIDTDETYADNYKQLLVEVIDKPDLPVVFNVNIGHAMPRCIIPFGVNAIVDTEKQIIQFTD